jgi:nucleotide-binding universal stress UspA family protein
MDWVRQTILQWYANSGKYQAIVLGSRGLNSLQEMVLGSVSHKVAKHFVTDATQYHFL